MLIRMRTQSCGPDGSFSPGTVRDVDDVEATALVEGGYAQFVEPQAADFAPRRMESAALAPPQEVASPEPAKRKRGRPRKVRTDE